MEKSTTTQIQKTLAQLRRRILPDLTLILFLALLPLVMFHQQTLGGRTLLPTENLYQHLPHSAYRQVVQAPDIPHNHLLSDMVLQNYQWKFFIREQLAQGEIPLWNPHQFAGIPFLAAGQHSALYPLSLVYYALPLASAYGWFIVLNLWLAGWFMAGFMRGLGINRAGAGLSGAVYQLSGFMIASAVFPMMVAAAVWMPLILWMIENILRRRGLWLFSGTAIPWVIIGAVALGCSILAGHIELTLYTLLIAGWYAGFRLLWQFVGHRRQTGRFPIRRAASALMWLTLMLILGLALAAIQLIPLYELAANNWRAERSSLETVLGFAHPARGFLQFLLPSFYGSPAHHSYVDVFSWERVTDLHNAAGESIHFIDWGIKNYVEGALYVGILPLALSLYAALALFRRRGASAAYTPYIILFGLLSLLALSFMFGAPSYALLYRLPGINQLNSPFRWVFALTLAAAALAGIGAHLLAARQRQSNLPRLFGYSLFMAGLALLLGIAVTWIGFEHFESFFNRIAQTMAKASQAFADGRMFYSYQFPGLLLLAVTLLVSGLIFWRASRSQSGRWMTAALAVTALDLLIASYGFNPASDPLLLDFTPPAIRFLQGQAGDFRITALQDPDQANIIYPNIGMSAGLDDARGYDSIIPAGYVAVMRALQPQHRLDYNRVSALFAPDEWNHDGGYLAVLDAPLFHLLNIKYVIAHHHLDIPLPTWKKVYVDEAVAIWENGSVMPRAFVVDQDDWNNGWLADDRGGFDYASFQTPSEALRVDRYQPAAISRDTGREKFIDANLADRGWLVISETYMPGWRAFARPRGSGEDAEFGVGVRLALANFQAVELPAGDWTVRLVYSPASFQVGLFGSMMSLALIAFLLGTWFWRTTVGLNTEGSSAAAKVARNSLAPILLNLFNRGIDFVFAIVMYRLLAPLDIGIYNFAIVLFVGFDIFTNFGLDLLLIREVSRKKNRAGHYLYNTALFRLFLSLAGAPLLAGCLFLWQSSGAEAISADGLIAIGLLYVGLFPASLSKGMTSLFYANEQAEKPAAIATIATMSKALFGVLTLALGYGIVGLAAVSIFNNILTFALLFWAGHKLIGSIGRRRPSRQLIRVMVGESFPLMLNHFLATIFFQIDIVLLQAIKGAIIVAQYSTAYKWLLAINIIPSFFTQALFPVMSRQAKHDLPALTRSFTFGIKLLFAITLPTAVAFTVLAESLTRILGGSPYVPQGVIALQLMIWSIPFGWMNSLAQYVLIALGLQRMITRAFAAAVSFNIIANILFIPRFNFQAAAIATIASEIALFLPFIYLLRGRLTAFSIVGLLWRPLAAISVMILVLLLWDAPAIPRLAVGGGLYAAALALLRPLDEAELALLPGRLKDSALLMRLLGGKRKNA